jgi:4-amino-4-deoxy-L-arabinose transferase-like glycosyltransferase
VQRAQAAEVRAFAALPTRWLYAAAFVAQLLVFLPLSALRLIDGDEGYYALGARLAVEGQVPYEDFFYLQMPLLPYVYGAWTEVFGESWYAVRSLSAMLAAALGVLVLRHALRRFGDRRLAVAALLLYASSALVLSWFTVAKTYALATLLLFGAYTLLDREDGSPTRAQWLAAGALAGLAVDVRLLFAAAVPVLAVYALAGARRLAERVKDLAALAGGLALGLVPSFVLFALGPDRFVFANVGLPAVRSDGGLIGGLRQKLDVAGQLIGVDTFEVADARITAGAAGAQLLLLGLAAAVALAAVWLPRRRVPLAFALAVAMALASIAPSPTYVQYFCTVVPFLVLAALELPAAVAARLSGGDDGLRLILRRAAAVVLAVYVAVAAVDVYLATDGGYAAAERRLGTVADVTRIVDANTEPGERVLSFWPGHLFGSHAEPIPGFENDSAPLAAEKAELSPQEAAERRLATADEIERLLRERRVRIVVHGPVLGQSRERDWGAIIAESGYQPLGRVGTTTVYEAPNR